MDSTLLIAGCLMVVATLFSSVGHGGASGYLAVMALFALPQDSIKPAALVLNIAVASLGLIAFIRQGKFDLKTLAPFAVAAVPMAFLGGRMTVPDAIYKPLLAAVLIFSAIYLWLPRSTPHDDPALKPPLVPALGTGAFIGFLSGLTGIGGGVFLSPVLLFAKWAPTQRASGVAAGFILLNSIAGLLGQAPAAENFPLSELMLWVPAVIVGGWVGSRYGSRTTKTKNIYRLLGAVMLVAAAKLVIPLG